MAMSTFGDPAIPAYGPASCPRGGRHEAGRGPGSPGRPGRRHVSNEIVAARVGAAIPAYGFASCPRGGRHEAARGPGSPGRPATAGLCGSRASARRSRPMDRPRVPGGEGTRRVVGRDPRADAGGRPVRTSDRVARVGAAIPACGSPRVPGGEGTRRLAGRDPRADRAAGLRIRTRVGAAIPAYGSASCPRGGRHEAGRGPGSPRRRVAAGPFAQ